MGIVIALAWFCIPVLLALAYLWASRRLPLPLWAGVLGPLNIVAIVVIALPALEVIAGSHRAHDLEAAIVAALLLQAPAALCWLAWKWLRAPERSASDGTPLGAPPVGGEVARLRRMTALRERARRDAASTARH
jgi:hypothetical protein